MICFTDKASGQEDITHYFEESFMEEESIIEALSGSKDEEAMNADDKFIKLTPCKTNDTKEETPNKNRGGIYLL